MASMGLNLLVPKVGLKALNSSTARLVLLSEVAEEDLRKLLIGHQEIIGELTAQFWEHNCCDWMQQTHRKQPWTAKNRGETPRSDVEFRHVFFLAAGKLGSEAFFCSIWGPTNKSTSLTKHCWTCFATLRRNLTRDWAGTGFVGDLLHAVRHLARGKTNVRILRK